MDRSDISNKPVCLQQIRLSANIVHVFHMLSKLYKIQPNSVTLEIYVHSGCSQFLKF